MIGRDGQTPDLVVVPVGGANFGSLRRACERVGVDPQFSADPARIRAASHVILPGVGAAAVAMQQLRDVGLIDVLKSLRQPVLGICLGMQLLFEHSEEGDCELLGLLPGQVRRLPPAPSWPHMGWNQIDEAGSDPAVPAVGVEEPAARQASRAIGCGPAAAHPLLAGIDVDDWFYFVHGYAAPVGAATLAATTFGRPFASLVAHGNVCGAQFHPEKSAAAGRRLLANFLRL